MKRLNRSFIMNLALIRLIALIMCFHKNRWCTTTCFFSISLKYFIDFVKSVIKISTYKWLYVSVNTKENLQVQDCYQAFIYVDINKCHCFFRLLYYYTSLFSACKVQDFGLSSKSLVPLKGGRKVCTLLKKHTGLLLQNHTFYWTKAYKFQDGGRWKSQMLLWII